MAENNNVNLLSIKFPGLDNTYISLSAELLEKVLKELSTNGGVAWKDDLTGLVDMKSAIIGDEKDNKDPTKKTFEAGDKTLWGAYNALFDKDEAVKQWAQAQDNVVKADANKYADDQDKAVKTEVANNLTTAKSELETSIATNLQSAKDYADQQDETVANTAQANLSTTKTELTTSIATNLQSAKDYAVEQDNAVKQ